MSMFNVTSVEMEYGGRKLKIETGKLARQADGAVLVTYGETQVLVTAVSASTMKEGIDFFPLTVEFMEKYYAAGRMPGGFFKRETKPSNDATLNARMIDRPIRPLFPEGYRYDTQVVASILSVDKENDPEIAAGIGASAALHISNIPLLSPVACARVGRIDGKYILNPSLAQQELSDMEIFVSGTKNAIMMVEGGAREVPEADVLGAILFGHAEIKKMITIIDELRKKTGSVEKRKAELKTAEPSFKTNVESLVTPIIKKALATKDKGERYAMYDKAKDDAVAKFIQPLIDSKTDKDTVNQQKKFLGEIIELVKYNLMREMILADSKRIDGRGLKDIRQIEVEAAVLPRVHGSSLFTRGETQVLAAVTLGTADDEQMIDVMRGTTYKKFMLNYNFPPFSVGETGRYGMPGRREIGHGALAERALSNMMPKECPYTVRIVCEVLESNGSSSMGSVCSGSMALMDAGIDFKKPVAGIAMGLIKEDKRTAILSDILGDEDHLGDMDFKVAGTKDGITAIQMDIKIEGVDEAIMRTALAQALEGRLHILGKMESAITQPKAEISLFAPRFTTIKIKQDKIREVIGSGGKVIKGIVEMTGCKIDIQDDGTINIASTDVEKAKQAEDIIKEIVAEPEIGKIYKGTVRSIVDFGAFIEIMPGTDGLLHVSEIAHERVNNVRDFYKEGDVVEVKCLEVDSRGKIRLSRKALIERPAGMPAEEPRPPRGDRGDRGDRGGRGGGRDFRGGDRDRGPRRDDRPRTEGDAPRGGGNDDEGGGDTGTPPSLQ